MGADIYWYYAKYEVDINTTLQALRQRELVAGRYNPVMEFIHFPITDDSPAPGSPYSSLDDDSMAAIMEEMEESGTRSILDIFQVSTIPYAQASVALEPQYETEPYFTTYPLSNDELIHLFGTDKPNHKMVETVIILSQQNDEAASTFRDSIDRGSCRHIVIYDNDEPVEVFFIGYSFD